MCDTAGFVRHCANTGMVCTHTHYRHSVCEYRYGVENPDPQYTCEKPCASDRMNLVSQSHNIFAASHVPLPEFLTGIAVSIQPQKWVIDIDPAQHIPPSISIELPVSSRCHIAASGRCNNITTTTSAKNIGQSRCSQFCA